MNVWLLTFLEDKDMVSVHMTVDGAVEYVRDVMDGMVEDGECEVTVTERREDFVKIQTELGDFTLELKPVGK